MRIKTSVGRHYLPGGFGIGKEPEVEKKSANRYRDRNSSKRKRSDKVEITKKAKKPEKPEIDIQFVDENRIQLYVQEETAKSSES